MRRILITGGSSGIGKAIADAFLVAGHDVIVASRSVPRDLSPELRHVVLDVCDPSAIADAVLAIGPIDVFAANAGAASTAQAMKTPPADWDHMIALNLTSVFHCAQAAIPPMVERGWGRFIAVGSTASLKGYRYASAYAAAKHGVVGLVRSLALELATTGVTANVICPGYTETPMIESAVNAIATKTGRPAADALQTFAAANPMQRLVTPAEVAAAALWLASDAAAAVSGQAIAIDGGETA